jgi:hypothetical protein
LEAEGVAPGLGKSRGFINRPNPGPSARQSPNAALPVSGPDWASAWNAPAAANAVASRYEISNRNRLSLHDLPGFQTGGRGNEQNSKAIQARPVPP